MEDAVSITVLNTHGGLEKVSSLLMICLIGNIVQEKPAKAIPQNRW